MRSKLRTLLLCASLATAAAVAQATAVQQPHSQAELVAERNAVIPGESFTLALRLVLEPDWHVYWKNPGDSGMATRIAWTLPSGFEAGAIQWPAPLRIPLPPLVSYGYENEVWLLTDLRAPKALRPGTSVQIAGNAEWLVCKDICLPASARLDLSLPVASAAAADPTHADAFARTRAALPGTLTDWKLEAYPQGQHYVLRVQPPQAATARLRGLTFFPEREGMVDNSRPQEFAAAGSGYELRIPLPAQAIGQTTALTGVLAAQPGFGKLQAATVDVPLQAARAAPSAPAPASTLGLAIALLLAFVGGLVLNLMPCVFPVLAIKILGVLQQAHGNARKLRSHGLLFALGVLVSFWAIAGLLLLLRAQGAALGWGYQLQSPLVVTGLALLFFVLGLNLSGVFQIGLSLQSAAGAVRGRGAHADAILTGLLAALVATPCTAPFMGAALGYAMVQPALHAMLVFTALALGMTTPYLVLCFVPALLRRLPRPGPWMESLKQLLAFPLYATVVWLAWVLGQQTGIDGVARLFGGLVAIGAALWALGRWSSSRSPGPRMASRLAAFALGVAGLAIALPQGSVGSSAPPAASASWQPWSEAAVHAGLAEGKAVFVDFTAAWCVTCQVNKKLVLQSEAVEQRFRELGVITLRADWTNQDPAITAALTQIGRSGVPVYALHLPGHDAPILLPEVLTRSIVLQALEGARKPVSAKRSITAKEAS
jgi:thiol:disulfide interchange protein DsbD